MNKHVESHYESSNNLNKPQTNTFGPQSTAQKQQPAPVVDKKKTKAMNALFSGISGDKKSDSDSDSDEPSPVKEQKQ